MEVWTCSHPPLPQFVGTEDTFIFGSDADEETARDRHRDDVVIPIAWCVRKRWPRAR